VNLSLYNHMKASDLFVKALENEGVEYIFGVPGEENLDILESLRTSKIKFIVTRGEQSAGFMAATVGRLTGKAGVALATLGPGATNLVTAAAYAQLGGMPMCMITGQKPVKKRKQGHFQIVQTTEIMQPVTKYSQQVIHGSSIPARVREAFRMAEEEKPGAVHLELPEDVAEEAVQEFRLFSREKVRRPIAEYKAINRAVEMIQGAKSPLLLIGAGANRKLTSKTLRDFIDTTGIPFFNTQMGKGVIDERHPLFLGTAALSDNDYIHCAIEKADLIINVGHDIVEKPPFFMKRDWQKVIHINFFTAKIDDIYFPQLEVVGDIANAIWQIKERLHQQKHWDFQYFLETQQRLEKHMKEHTESKAMPVVPQRIVADVRSVLPDDGIVTLDNGMFKIWFARNYRAYLPNTLLLDNALATMGAGLSSAIAAKLVYPQKKVIAVCGDGGFMMNSQELETAVRLKLDIVIMILNDNGYGMIQWKQHSMGFPDFGLHYGNPDFVSYAVSFGAQGQKIKKAAELQANIHKAFRRGGVNVIEVPIDYSMNYQILTAELQNKTCNF